jgi:hypothetical protein
LPPLRAASESSGSPSVSATESGGSACAYPPKPWYRAPKDAWYVEFNGKQVRPAKDRDNYKAAVDSFYKLMTNGSGKLPGADCQGAEMLEQLVDALKQLRGVVAA